jgi:hypothetical protein
MLFHGQQQHVVVSLDGKIDQVYVRAAVDVVLKACLSRGLGSRGRAILDPRDDCQDGVRRPGAARHATMVFAQRHVGPPWPADDLLIVSTSCLTCHSYHPVIS